MENRVNRLARESWVICLLNTTDTNESVYISITDLRVTEEKDTSRKSWYFRQNNREYAIAPSENIIVCCNFAR